MPVIKAIIFDLDGVLIDSEPLHFKIMKKFLKHEGVNLKKLPPEVFGRRVIDITKILKVKFKLKKSATFLYQDWRAIAVKMYKRVKPMPYAQRALSWAQKENFKLALATSTSYHALQWVFKAVHFKKYFSVVVTGDMVNKGKPSPAIYRKTLKMLKVKSSEAAVIEDSVNGIVSAKKAGLKCVALIGTFSASKLKKADIIIKSLKEINSELIKKIFNECF